MIANSYQNHGLGRMLYKCAFDYAKENGNLNQVVPKSKIRAGIKDIVLEASR